MLINLEFVPIARGKGINEKNNKVQVMGIVPDSNKKNENGLFENNSAFPPQSIGFGIKPELADYIKGGVPVLMKLDMITTKTGCFFNPIAMSVNGKWEAVSNE